MTVVVDKRQSEKNIHRSKYTLQRKHNKALK